MRHNFSDVVNDNRTAAPAYFELLEKLVYVIQLDIETDHPEQTGRPAR